ncbi:MAG: hypothetical protein A3H52_02170 [Candidatus Zambryskibacteria bacterium RIFCSPLOWO2_02_FULL_39_26]|uniref:Alkyl hydroperoxide reductase subunit C/ Thiol specific antioxidant domain-containing protein n=1 Tax=Candidatus Zambryskibacteria bacterium RIFCSPLOWO2_12_FULL_39_23 TaxID=1802776 RepID=A0A1G2URK0_9BACT|nr:MAG: hypothetical protein A3E59_00620 [Candidatus Zambryskibacteria bacterium RIFCSPHIGHO2_12_FULL_39_47]OHB09396.1 MAG: hypothetical protein A3H52_02170 [Candidatus Zambryskibacteria bacterium RIFCSPLOWO2_02_FULL_39_26]OHB11989.1 MAG: hypothetical protein A3G99_02805 [Candidatus Zambryskibacteria bacterium RIFCSPLOWO2_12_FULL_39_23]
MRTKEYTIFAVLIAGAFLLGFFLFKNPPGKTAVSSGTLDHHGGTATVSISNALLNSLVDKPLPDIILVDKDGNTTTTADLKGKAVVFFFNEGLMCYPACWNQVAGFGSDPRFNNGKIQAYSVLVDSAKDWQRAIDKMPELAKAQTLFDTGASASRQLGLLTLPSSMHRGSLPGHTYIVVDKDGIVRYVKDDPNMAMANNEIFNKIAEFK